ncbi:DUF6957 family protein [Pseudomonas veronii]|uniref:DUF6957 family protein n=1 Tax=Pseudomonas veronii TaxID=76761 RepID=UPI002D76C15A|nr:hypothetical protein [Pseudomonas veronii]WRU61191.1 hypothetical protein VPH48_23615 [Pseudomonas veronii]
MPLLTGTLLLSLSTIAGAKISNPPWVNFQSAGWVSFQSAPTLSRLGLLPATLFAHEIVLDSKGRFQPSMWVRSNFGVSFTEGCMFETKNTVYLLLGPGLRKVASIGAAFSMKAV